MEHVPMGFEFNYRNITSSSEYTGRSILTEPLPCLPRSQLTRLLAFYRAGADAEAEASSNRMWCWASIHRKRAPDSHPVPQRPRMDCRTGRRSVHTLHIRWAGSRTGPSCRSPDVDCNRSGPGSSPCNASRRCRASTLGCRGRAVGRPDRILMVVDH